ncbi:MAG: methionine synthase [Deltaproteobacteria bacterium]|nr:methionine synthase [Deltaproteobacteria bacterium]
MPLKKLYYNRARIGRDLSPNDPVKKIADEIYKEGLKLAKGILYHHTFKINDIPQELIPAKFSGCRSITMFASTIGSEITERVEYYLNTEKILQGTLLDSWGSESLEMLNDSFDEILREKYGQGTIRFSPGYGDIPVSRNELFLQLLKISGVTSNKETGILNPIKSTTCMIGWHT